MAGGRGPPRPGRPRSGPLREGPRPLGLGAGPRAEQPRIKARQGFWEDAREKERDESKGKARAWVPGLGKGRSANGIRAQGPATWEKGGGQPGTPASLGQLGKDKGAGPETGGVRAVGRLGGAQGRRRRRLGRKATQAGGRGRRAGLLGWRPRGGGEKRPGRFAPNANDLAASQRIGQTNNHGSFGQKQAHFFALQNLKTSILKPPSARGNGSPPADKPIQAWPQGPQGRRGAGPTSGATHRYKNVLSYFVGNFHFA
jgi:hypothetical protein